MRTPMTDLFFDQTAYGYGGSLGWHYRRAYLAAAPGSDPASYFSVTHDKSFFTVESLGVRGGEGWLRFNSASITKLFRCAKRRDPGSYRDWAEDEHPVGGEPRLLRVDDSNSKHNGGVVLEPDFHPCQGHMYFGDPEQECEQLAAFWKLETMVRAIDVANVPSVQERAEAAQRASVISARANPNFLPRSGYCYRCDGDVTIAYADAPSGTSITGCHLCGASWCD